jgi:hypothetical protein
MQDAEDKEHSHEHDVVFKNSGEGQSAFVRLHVLLVFDPQMQVF